MSIFLFSTVNFLMITYVNFFDDGNFCVATKISFKISFKKRQAKTPAYFVTITKLNVWLF
jgi:hypothetical protein